MAIMSSHHPLAFAFGVLGNIVSTMVYLAPMPTFWRIHRKRSTEGFKSLPYLVALFSSMLWFYYAMLKNDAFLLITINSFGCVIETIYIGLYIAYASRKNRISTIKVFATMNMGLFSLILLITEFLVENSVRAKVLGWINVAVNVSVFASPLSIVAQVIRTRSVEFMPFPLSFFLTLTAITWFSMAYLQRISLPNILGFLLGLVQMVLYAVYRNASEVMEEQKLPENLKTIVILSTLGASEVYPVEAKSEVDEVAKELEQAEPRKQEKAMEAQEGLQSNGDEV
ncbi:hypothetical protein K2173_006928 [Erythroxylum novogranatense]|uniref:Bidirectional sugar transporter SWEET n=1 Tax=Erythroxylum novogranatense TaxID=1862640 RepID=A0AAV8SZB6_9ROSI|nr:hypothetical protein K2173_006928 [Erythroxylum novogranatense]